MATKKRSNAYRLVHEPTGHHYVVRLGRLSAEKMMEKSKAGEIKRFNPRTRSHEVYTLKKTK